MLGAPHATSRSVFLLTGASLLVLGIVLVLLGLEKRGIRILPRGAAIASGAVALLTLLPTRRGGPYVGQLLFGTAGSAFVFAALLALPASASSWLADRGAALSAAVGRAAGTSKVRIRLALFASALVVAAAFARILFHGVPHVSDGAAQLFQARIFAAGHLTAPAPAIPKFFSGVSMIVREGRWYSMYPPGHSLMLVGGVVAGAPWLVNPALGALAVVLIALAGSEIYDEMTGRLAAVLALASPFVCFMSSEFMNHATAMAAFAACLYFLARMRNGDSAWSGAAAGLAGGLLVLTRPYSAFGLLLPLALGAFAPEALFLRRWRTLAAALVTGSVCVGLLLAYNAVTNGSPWVFGYETLHGARVGPGFGHSVWGPALTLPRAIDNSLTNANALEGSLLGWPVPSLLFVFGLFAFRRARPWDRILVLPLLGLFAVNFFYWYLHLAFGPRFFYESVPCLVLLTARGLRELHESLVALEERLSGFVPSAVLAFTIWAICLQIPFLARIYGNDYLGGTSRVVEAVKKKGLKNVVVFVNTFYPSAFSQNVPDLDGPVVYARDLPDRADLMTLYPGFTAWREAGGVLEPVPPAR